MKKSAWLVLALVIIVGTIITASKQETKTLTETPDKANLVAETPKDKVEKTPDESVVVEKKEEGQPEAVKPTAIKGVYKNYSIQAVSEANSNRQKIVLFFHAKWCSECIKADAAFLLKATELPDNVVVLKTDYDTEKTLKTKYGVTYQHTFVQVDAEGNMLTKWNGGDLDTLRTNLK